MTESELAAIEARCAAATPGPIASRSSSVGGWHSGYFELLAGENPLLGCTDSQCCYGFTRVSDAIFYSEARFDVPRLVAQVRALQNALDVHERRWRDVADITIGAVEVEREACAKVAEERPSDSKPTDLPGCCSHQQNDGGDCGECIAFAIRARSGK